MKRKFYWKCAVCNVISTELFSEATDAARAAIQEHGISNVAIYSGNKTYVGLAYGLLFHCGKVIKSPSVKKRK